MMRPLGRAALLAGGAALVATIVAVAIVLVIAAAGGVLTTPPRAWVLRLRLLPGVPIEVSVPGLARFATSPIALRLLDGRRLATRFGTLQFARADGTLQVDCAPCLLDEPRLAQQTVRIEHARLRLARADARTLAGELASGDVRLPFTARLQPERIDIDWQLPPTELAALYRVLANVIPEAHLARIDGRLHARGSVQLPQRRLQVAIAIDGFAVTGLGTERLAEGPSEFGCNGDGRRRPYRIVPGEGRWISPNQSGALLAAAVLAAEDQRFYEHPGFDREEVAQVLAAADGEAPLRGASTITQQLARGLFTGGERTAARKLRELLYAVEMERTLGKNLILALYLNTVDWGPGICGADAAARTYFGKRPYQLTPLEAAWLAAILRNPAQAYVQQFLAGAADRDRAEWVLQQMRTLPRREREHWTRQALAFGRAPGRPAVVAAR
jgi:hypothetical protein